MISESSASGQLRARGLVPKRKAPPGDGAKGWEWGPTCNKPPPPSRSGANYVRIGAAASRFLGHNFLRHAPDVFVRVHDIEAAGMKLLVAGQLVAYEIGLARDGRSKAIKLRLLNP